MSELFYQRLSDRDFCRISRLVEASVGIHLPEHKRSMVELRTARRARATGITDLGNYCDFVFGDRGEGEQSQLIDALTTNKTEFFREPEHYTQLLETVLPDIRQRREQREDVSPLRVWSAGCSTGEEPYTLAIVLARHATLHPSFEFSIVGTDISGRALSAAVQGVYPEESITRVPPEYRRMSFLRNKNHELHLVRVAPEIRRHVEFMRHNLFDPARPTEERFDVIFCRNVIIYFERENQIKVLENLARALRPGGYLFVGHSEALHGMPLPIEHVGPTLYQKTAS
jgi:chemotaxis protein methyltransferase CheR